MTESITRGARRLDSNRVGFSNFELFLCSVLLFIAPFEAYLVSLIGGIVKYVLLFAILYVLYKDYYHSRTLHLNWYITGFLAWFAIKITSVLWTTNLAIPKLHFASQVGMVGFFFVLNSIEVDRRSRDTILLSMYAGSLLFCILSLFLMKPYALYTQRFVLTIMGVQMDPNNAGAIALPSFALSIYWMVQKQGAARKLFYAVSVLVSSYVILMTGSRGSMLGMAAIVLLLVFVSRDIGMTRKAIMIAILCLGLFLVLSITPIDTLNRLFGDYGDGSGRSELWKMVWNAFLSQPLLGVGWGGVADIINMATHNTFLSMLAEQGILGSLFFVFPIAFVFIASLKNKSTVATLLLVSALFPALTIDAINKRFLWYGITVAFMVFRGHITDRCSGHAACEGRKDGLSQSALGAD